MKCSLKSNAIVVVYFVTGSVNIKGFAEVLLLIQT